MICCTAVRPLLERGAEAVAVAALLIVFLFIAASVLIALLLREIVALSEADLV